MHIDTRLPLGFEALGLPEALTDTLDAIAKSVGVSCTYSLGEYDPGKVDLNTVNFYFDQEAVPYDAGCALGQGWTWVDETTKDTVEFCRQACTLLEETDVQEISATVGCPRIGVV